MYKKERSTLDSFTGYDTYKDGCKKSPDKTIIDSFDSERDVERILESRVVLAEISRRVSLHPET